VATKSDVFTALSQDKQLSNIMFSLGGQSQTTDKRGRLYAILGLIRDTHTTEALRPDYNKTYPEVAFDLVTYFIEKQNLGLLPMLEKGVDKMNGMPTWVPQLIKR
jgi:hypothetical protein